MYMSLLVNACELHLDGDDDDDKHDDDDDALHYYNLRFYVLLSGLAGAC